MQFDATYNINQHQYGSDRTAEQGGFFVKSSDDPTALLGGVEIAVGVAPQCAVVT